MYVYSHFVHLNCIHVLFSNFYPLYFKHLFEIESHFRGNQVNADLSRWDVSRVKSMESLFRDAFAFDLDTTSNWDVGRVLDNALITERKGEIMTGSRSNAMFSIAGIKDLIQDNSKIVGGFAIFIFISGMLAIHLVKNSRIRVVDNDNDSCLDVAESNDSVTCCICMEERSSHAFVPCGHLSVCSECAVTFANHRLRECPVCRNKATGVIRIYSRKQLING